MSRRLIIGAALAVIAAAAACRGDQNAPASTSVERPSTEILLAKPYSGPKQDTPRSKDGKPLLTGYWKLLHEEGKPDGNLAKDRPDFTLPYTPQGRETLAAKYKRAASSPGFRAC